MTARIELVEKDEPRVRSFLEEKMSPLSRVILFGGDRWLPVEIVALAFLNGELVGMGSLAPTNELRAGGPHIIGVWVKPDARHFGVGVDILAALAEESQLRYSTAPRVVATTKAGCALCRKALIQGIRLEFQDIPPPAGVIPEGEEFELP